MRVGICGPHRLLRRALAEVLDRSPDIDIADVRRDASRLPSAELDAVVVLLPATIETAIEAIEAISPAPALIVSSQRVIEREVQVWCDARSCSVADIEHALHILAADQPRVAALVDAGSSHRKSQSDLTDRELQVLRLVARGLTAQEMADHLGLKRRTVENHKARVFAKLGVQSQSHAVSTALRDGLLAAEADTGPSRQP